jgi:hypothetical protein
LYGPKIPLPETSSTKHKSVGFVFADGVDPGFGAAGPFAFPVVTPEPTTGAGEILPSLGGHRRMNSMLTSAALS